MPDERGAALSREPDPAEVARGYEQIIERFVNWAVAEEDIRAAVVIGSRARTDHPADAWADLDIVILSSDPNRLARDSAWTMQIGEPWIAFVERTPDGAGLERRVLFAGGLDVDFTFLDTGQLLEAEFLESARATMARGVRPLLDKDGLLARLEALAADAGPPETVAPDAETINEVVADFWYHAVWTAKHMRRGELWWAKGGCDVHLKELLRRALEWDATAAGRDAWFRGRFLDEWADPGAVEQLHTAFARYDEADVWSALAATMDLFSEVVRRATSQLGLPYLAEAEVRARELVSSYWPEGTDGTGE